MFVRSNIRILHIQNPQIRILPPALENSARWKLGPMTPELAVDIKVTVSVKCGVCVYYVLATCKLQSTSETQYRCFHQIHRCTFLHPEIN